MTTLGVAPAASNASAASSIPVCGAGHVDFGERVNLIPFDKLTTIFQKAPKRPNP